MKNFLIKNFDLFMLFQILLVVFKVFDFIQVQWYKVFVSSYIYIGLWLVYFEYLVIAKHFYKYDQEE